MGNCFTSIPSLQETAFTSTARVIYDPDAKEFTVYGGATLAELGQALGIKKKGACGTLGVLGALKEPRGFGETLWGQEDSGLNKGNYFINIKEGEEGVKFNLAQLEKATGVIRVSPLNEKTPMKQAAVIRHKVSASQPVHATASDWDPVVETLVVGAIVVAAGFVIQKNLLAPLALVGDRKLVIAETVVDGALGGLGYALTVAHREDMKFSWLGLLGAIAVGGIGGRLVRTLLGAIFKPAVGKGIRGFGDEDSLVTLRRQPTSGQYSLQGDQIADARVSFPELADEVLIPKTPIGVQISGSDSSFIAASPPLSRVATVIRPKVRDVLSAIASGK